MNMPGVSATELGAEMQSDFLTRAAHLVEL